MPDAHSGGQDTEGLRERGEQRAGTSEQTGSVGAKRPKIAREDSGGGRRSGGGKGGGGGSGGGAPSILNGAVSSASALHHQQGSQLAQNCSVTTATATNHTASTASFSSPSETAASPASGGYAARLPDGVSGAESYMTPELVRQYWLHQLQLQAKEAEVARIAAAAVPSGSQECPTGVGNTAEEGLLDPGNLGQEVPLSAHAQGSSHSTAPSSISPLPPTPCFGGFSPKFHAGSPVTNTSQSLPWQQAGTCGLQSPADLSRLIPQLEALASSLQNPAAVESAQYLAALSQNQMLTSLANAAAATAGQLLAPGTTENSKHQATITANLELFSALASSDVAKYLPALASVENQSQSLQIPVDQLKAHLLYGADLQAMKELSQKGQAASMEGFDHELTVDPVHGDHALASSSFLLDGNFPLDIPPPSDLELVPEPVSTLGTIYARNYYCCWSRSHIVIIDHLKDFIWVELSVTPEDLFM